MEQLGVGVVHASSDLRVLRASRRAAEILGYAVSELVGADLRALAAPGDAPMSAGGEPRDLRLAQKGGAIIWCHVVASARHDDGTFLATLEDITAKRSADTALRESEARLRDAQRIARVGSFTWDLLTSEHRWSEQLYRLWEIAPETPITVEMLRERLHPDDRARVDRAFDDAMATGAAIDVTERLLFPDGRQRHLRVRAEARRVHGSSARVIAGTAEDITAELEAQRALEDRERTLSTILDATFEMLLLVDRDAGGVWRVVAANRALLAESHKYGLDVAREQVVGRPLFEVMHQVFAYPDDASAAAVARYDDVARTGEPIFFGVELPTPNGTTFIENVVVPIRDHAGDIRRALWSGRDITAQKRAEAGLQRLNAELERRVAARTAELADLYDRAPCGYHSLAADGTFLRVNETELAWLGRTSDELVGRARFADLLTPEGRDVLAALEPELAARGEIADVEVSLLRADGSAFAVSLSARQIRDASGAICEIRGSIVDNTRRKLAEEGLRKSRDALSVANAALESASRAKDEFFASMSHELRTPLNAVLGLSEALHDGVYGPVGARQQRALQRIDESGRHLLSLLSDILDVSKIEAGRMALEVVDIAVEDVCDASLRLIQEAARKKRHRISFQVGAGAGYLRADERRLTQILVNLLSNAVKFTPEDGEIGLEVEEDDAAEGLRFAVWDTGIGIAPEDLGRLFQPFVQLDSSLSRRHAGTGLGLALVRKLVELHGGSLSVESVPGLGSRFTVALPRSRRPRPASAPPPPPRARASGETGRLSAISSTGQIPGALRVLLADDDELNVSTFRDYLRARGYEVDVARNGREALAIAHEATPDVVLMDVQMPLMDGLTAIRALRASEDARLREVPIIALTALAMVGDRERCLDAGADDYLTKPVGLKQLLAVIEGRLLA